MSKREYVERELLLKRNMYGNTNPITHRTYAENLIKSVPAADVKEVRHGEWLGERGEYECSVCGSEAPDDNYWPSPYCPCCGAKMDEKEDV